MRPSSLLLKLFALCLGVWLFCSGCRSQALTGRPHSIPTAQAPTTGAQLTWNAPQQNEDGSSLIDLSGYIINYGTHHKGTHHKHYPCEIDVGKRTSYLVTGLTPGRRYCFVVRAYNTSGNKSQWSSEACVTAPSSPAMEAILSQQPLIKGATGSFQVRGVRPGETVVFLFSTVGVGEEPCGSDWDGHCVDILQPQPLGQVQADASGIATLVAPIPHRDGCVITQAVIPRGIQGADSIKTNVLTETVR